MKVTIHDLLHGSHQTFEGDAKTLERELEKEYPWAVEGNEGDLESILWTLDHQQFHGVEVVDPTPHPFLRG
jgi:hypothetical protein